MSGPDPSKTHPSASDALPERSSTKFETDLADLAARFSAHSGGGLSPELSADLALEIVFNEIVEQACLATGATGAAIVLERDGEMVCRASSGATAPALGSRIDTSSGLSGECFKTRRTQWCDDALSDQRANAQASQRLGVRSVVVMPLLRQEKILGVIELFSSHPYAFGVRDERTLEILADRTLNNLDHAAHPLQLQRTPEATRASRDKAEQKPLAPEAKSQPETALIERDRINPNQSSNDQNSNSQAGNSPRAQSLTEEDEEETQRHWTSPRGQSHETSGIEHEADTDRSVSDPSGWLLGAAALACAILLGLVVGRHWGARNAHLGSNRSSRATQSSSPVKAADIPATSTFAVTKPGVQVPAGGLPVSENGKQVFRMPPKHTAAATADQAVGVERASSVEPDGVMQLTPAAAENGLLQRVEPDYPEAAREQSIQGTVVLEVHIAADGSVQDVQVVSGPPPLAEASTAAVKLWKFKPRLVKGSPVEMQTRVTLNFRLPSEPTPQQ